MIAVTIAMARIAAVLFAALGVALALSCLPGCTNMAPQYAAQQYAPSYYEGGYNTLTPQQKFQLEDHLSNQSNRGLADHRASDERRRPSAWRDGNSARCNPRNGTARARAKTPKPSLTLGAGVTPAQGSVKPTAGFTLN